MSWGSAKSPLRLQFYATPAMILGRSEVNVLSLHCGFANLSYPRETKEDGLESTTNWV